MTRKIPHDLQTISRGHLDGFPQKGRFVEAVTDQAAVATVAGEEPRQVFEATASAWNWFFHVVDESLSRPDTQDVDLVSRRAKSGNYFKCEIDRDRYTSAAAIGFSRSAQGQSRGFHRRRRAKGGHDRDP